MELDTGSLAIFVGFAAADRVQAVLDAAGHGDLRFSHGYVFQHLIEGAPTIGELAESLGVTQQAASKAVTELDGLGYTERFSDPLDARVRRVRLTDRGSEAVEIARRARTELERDLAERLGPQRLAAARTALEELLDELGGADAVRRRNVRPPR
ncbi:MarR family winged helix-turn-helix transcriptional regulator [Actinomadura rudentiformis]|uniref:Winged helix DNA-binding protein n=1 Tax=Actinomadura rudentiformis TaxID=359158 RepID=A0A6H9Z9E6_9ACTN|nr:MarR family transcriptional regulator [Actinomadura rudentiformis]KAB2352295.1 winged helix DNA-binding protein [Actinomadura rudentiformis]